MSATPISPDPFSRLAVVMLRPKSPGNVGSVARAMKNMGFSRLVVADPMTYDDPAYFDDESRRMAWQAADLLEARRTEPDLITALAPFHLVVGTTSNPPEGARTLPPRRIAAEIAAHLAARPADSAALLLGQEDIGLTRDHLSRCHVVGLIPSASIYPSLNLAQAALVFLYELRLRLLEGSAPPPADPASATAGEPAPTHEDLEAFYGRLEQALETIGFLQGTARPHMMRELRRIFNRSALTSRELAVFEGMVHQIVWAAGRRV
ncbi:MAG TPA: TrmH family RNA methyltransferase [Candidatus Polarisedimenticolia bacterium]